jgi:hypothetical protein
VATSTEPKVDIKLRTSLEKGQPMIELLDVGGEGRLERAVNLNVSSVKTLGKNKGQPIPHLLHGRADAIPLPVNSVRTVVMERTPLTGAAVIELRRVTAPGGCVILRHNASLNDPHKLANAVLGKPVSTSTMAIGSQLVQQSVFRVRG